MKKQFDLKYYFEHPETKVVTRDGRSVRILCTDAKILLHYHVVGLISCDGSDHLCSYLPNGLGVEGREDKCDLFFDLPDPKKKKVPLTYTDLLDRVKSGKTMWFVNDSDTVFNIVDFDFEFVYIINGDTREVVPYSYEELMNGMTFADGDHCWKEVEE